MVVVFETHATSADNEAGLASGWYDVDLSPLGERQARELGARRRGDGLAAVYASDLRRARCTAEIAFGGEGLPIACDRRLRECDYGTLTRAPVKQVESLRLDFIDVPFPGGESYADVTRRVASFLDEAWRAHAGETLLLVGHRATYFALEHLLNGRPLREVIAVPWQWQPGWVYSWSRAGARPMPGR